MASTQPEAPALTAAEIIALGDAELIEFLERSRGPDGVIDLDLVAEFSEDDKERFFKKLRDRVSVITAITSPAVDLDHVTKRLLEIPADNISQRLSRRFRSPTPPAKTQEEIERESYADLVSDGGRPCYPASLLESIASDPKRHSHITSPWSNLGSGPATCQRGSWRLFRQWQRFSRMDYAGWGQPRSDVLCELAFTRFVEHFRLEDLDLPEYTKALKALLNEDNVDRPFQLEQDPSQQGRLSTWIEYLGYEYWRYRWHSSIKERLQPDYDKVRKAFQSGQYEKHLVKEYQDTITFYDETKQNKARHEACWRWVRDQLPLVEAEVEAAKVAGSTSTSRRRKRKLSANGDVSAEPQTFKKRTRSSLQTSPPDKAAMSTQTATASKRPKQRTSTNTAAQVSETKSKAVSRNGITPQPAGEPAKLRRSARLAAL